MRSLKALDGTADYVVEKVAVWTLNSSKDECNNNDDNFTFCTAILLNICEFEPQIIHNIFFLYIPSKILLHLTV